MKLALIGYGKMGRLIDTLAPEYGFETTARLDRSNNAQGSGVTREGLAGAQVAIEFSSPAAAMANLSRLAALSVPTVTGTTGWFDHLADVSAWYEAAGTGLIWGANFSLGVAVFNRVVGLAAELLKDESAYEAWAWEIHHSAKKDAPSGTLLQLVDTMKKRGYAGRIDVSSSRAGKVPGTHEIGFDSAADTITLRHTARSREGFARGALKAAQWISGRKGVFTFEQGLFGE